jgi:hypothetical protein
VVIKAGTVPSENKQQRGHPVPDTYAPMIFLRMSDPLFDCSYKWAEIAPPLWKGSSLPCYCTVEYLCRVSGKIDPLLESVGAYTPMVKRIKSNSDW